MGRKVEGERPIFSDIPINLFMKNIREGKHVVPIKLIPEAEIADFCEGCNSYKPERNTCEVLDTNTQAIYVDEKICGLRTTS